MSEHNLNSRQKKFADEYIANGGNGAQAALTAGYSEKTARYQASRMLTKDNIQAYLKESTEAMWDESKMTVSEALAISASIARGEPQKSYHKKVNKQTGKVVQEFEFINTPHIEERQKSLEHIFRVSGAFLERKEIDAKITPVFVDDISSDDDG